LQTKILKQFSIKRQVKEFQKKFYSTKFRRKKLSLFKVAFHYFYSYVEFSEGKGAQRPMVPINIGGYEFTGLVDSGSDAIVIPREIAEAMKLEIVDKTELSQLDGSKIDCDIAEVEFEFGKGHENYKFKSRVLITDSPRIILGRNGFFNRFKITFEDDKRLLTFRKIEQFKMKHW